MPITVTGIGSAYDDGGRTYQAEMEIIQDNGTLGITGHTMFVMVDLSDTTNFPHTRTNSIIIKGIRYSLTPASGTWSVYLAVVDENDATDGTVTILDCNAGCSNSAQGNLSRSFEDGLNCKVTAGTPDYLIGYDILGATALLQNDVARSSPAGKADDSVTYPGPGDIVMYCNEDAAGNLLGRVQVIYSAV